MQSRRSFQGSFSLNFSVWFRGFPVRSWRVFRRRDVLHGMYERTRSGTCHGMEMEGFRKDELPSLCLSRRSAEAHESPSILSSPAS